MKVFIFSDKQQATMFPFNNQPDSMLLLMNISFLDYHIEYFTTENNQVNIISENIIIKGFIETKYPELSILPEIPSNIINEEIIVSNASQPLITTINYTDIKANSIYFHSWQNNSKFLFAKLLASEYWKLKDDIANSIIRNLPLDKTAISFPIIKYPWDMLAVNEFILPGNKMEDMNVADAVVEPFATLKGKVIAGKGTIIKNGSYIEGPVIIGTDCIIGPNCYLRGNTVIGNNCRIGNAVEVKNSQIGNNVNICHLSYIGDSVIGNNVNIAAGNISGNLRHDHAEIQTIMNSEKISSGRNKLGVLIGDNVHTGINTVFYPGRKIASGKSTMPSDIVSKDIT